jgi:uncharacterized phage-like protein YoqJ
MSFIPAWIVAKAGVYLYGLVQKFFILQLFFTCTRTQSTDVSLYNTITAFVDRTKPWRLPNYNVYSPSFRRHDATHHLDPRSKEPEKNQVVIQPQYGRRFACLNGIPTMVISSTHKVDERGSAATVFTSLDIWHLRCHTMSVQSAINGVWAEDMKAWEEKMTAVYSNHYAGWDFTGYVSKRPLKSIVWRNETKTDLLQDLDNFLDIKTSQWYGERCLRYRRGYLLYGPPGTGKSSTAMALAGHYNLAVYRLMLSGPGFSNNNLEILMRSLRRPCMVLVEDIDCVGIDGRQTKNTDLTFSGILNAFDGVASSEGYILILTSNHVEKLDDALIRPGRIDKHVYFPPTDEQQNRDMFKLVFKELKEPELSNLATEFSSRIAEGQFSAAKIQEYLLSCKDNPRKAVSEIRQWVTDNMSTKPEQE